MLHSAKILRVVSMLCGSLIIVGIIAFLWGYIGAGYELLTGIGIGMTMGGVFIFIMGIFLVATEEAVRKNKGDTI